MKPTHPHAAGILLTVSAYRSGDAILATLKNSPEGCEDARHHSLCVRAG